MAERFIPIYQPDLTGKEREYVLACLDSTWISSKGAFIAQFEQAFANYVDTPHATTVSNGTVAIHLALMALGIGPGDEVIVPTLTYIASANAVTYTGATPVFVDSDPGDWQISPDDIRAKITPRTKAIMPVHLYGAPCDMDAIGAIAAEYGLFVVEDCAEALGTFYKGRHVGTFGDISSFSFFGNKTITTGEGGMVVTRDPELARRAIHLKGQGLAPSRQYWHDVVGYNYRMTNICAAIGLAQLERIGTFIDGKRRAAERYARGLEGLPVTLQPELPGTCHSYWMIAAMLDDAADRDPLRAWLDERGIETRPVFYPVHTMPMYQRVGERHPVAEELGARGINVPSWPGLTEADVARVCATVRGYYRAKADQGRAA